MDRQQDRRGEQQQALAPQVVPDVAPLALEPGAALSPTAVIALQRSAGNSAVAGLMPGRSGRAEPPRPATAHDGTLERELVRTAQRRAARSPALALRRLLRTVTTSGGDWDTEKYDLLKDVDQNGNPLPAAVGARGLDIKLKFKPNALVDAETIGLTQSVQAFVNNAPRMTPAASTRAIPAADAIPINTGPGETDEATAIDRAAGFNNPIYPVDNPASTSLADPSTDPGWGQHGSNYKDATGTLKHQEAKLFDTPLRTGAQTDSRHIFETTALATKGAQSGTYYGSVRWGWRTDAAGAFTKLTLDKVSDGVPSSTFLKAAGIWNPGSSSTGAANVDLPIPDVKVTTGAVKLMPPIPMRDINLPVGTRLQITREWVAPLLTGEVKVVDGPHTGITGEVDPAEWGNIADERS